MQAGFIHLSVGRARPGGSVASRRCAGEEGEDFADGRFLAGGLPQWHVDLDLVAVAPSVFVLHHVAASARSATMPWALRSVMLSRSAMSRSRTPGSRAMHSS